MRHRNLRTALAVEVVAAAMPDTTTPMHLWTDEEVATEYDELSKATTRRGAILNCALHALLTHDKYDTSHTLTESPDPHVWRLLIEQAIKVGQSCQGTWDGVEFAWEHHAERLTRYIESVCTYWVPDTEALMAGRLAL